MNIWILTYEINEYGQDGEYFLAVFDGYPTKDHLSKFLSKASETTLQHVLRGGGREGVEYEWYHLREYEAH